MHEAWSAKGDQLAGACCVCSHVAAHPDPDPDPRPHPDSDMALGSDPDSHPDPDVTPDPDPDPDVAPEDGADKRLMDGCMNG